MSTVHGQRNSNNGVVFGPGRPAGPLAAIHEEDPSRGSSSAARGSRETHPSSSVSVGQPTRVFHDFAGGIAAIESIPCAVNIPIAQPLSPSTGQNSRVAYIFSPANGGNTVTRVTNVTNVTNVYTHQPWSIMSSGLYPNLADNQIQSSQTNTNQIVRAGTVESIPESAAQMAARPAPEERDKEQRRRERRERRAARRHQRVSQCIDPYAIHGLYGEQGPPGGEHMLNPPPPPYSTLPSGARRAPPPPGAPPMPPPTGPGASPRHRGWRQSVLPGFPSPEHRRSRTSLRAAPPLLSSDPDDPKSCCGVTVSQTVSIRWFIVMIAFVGICCSVVGTVLGAMKASGREHLTVSLLMIGVGIVLITVSGIAWRLTATDAPSCRAMLGLGGLEDEYNGRFLTRPMPSAGYGRPQHPYAAMMYSDFHYRPPPPSYQASMQEYRLRLLLLDRQQNSSATGSGFPAAGAAVSPPPSYRPPMRSPLTHGLYQTLSRPPSYRSSTSDPIVPHASATADPNANGLPDPTPSEGAADVHGVSVVNVDYVDKYNDSIKESISTEHLITDTISSKRSKKRKGSKQDSNLVTIVQTTTTESGWQDSGHPDVRTAGHPVIVTVSGSVEQQDIRAAAGEVEILAHL